MFNFIKRTILGFIMAILAVVHFIYTLPYVEDIIVFLVWVGFIAVLVICIFVTITLVVIEGDKDYLEKLKASLEKAAKPSIIYTNTVLRLVVIAVLVLLSHPITAGADLAALALIYATYRSIILS